MRKNVAGQFIAFEMIDKTTGDAKTTGTPVVDIVIDNGTPIVGTGTKVHKVKGSWNYLPTQAETNGTHIDFVMSLTGAITRTLNVYTGTQQSENNDTKISLIPTTQMRGTNNVPTNPALDTDYTAARAAKIDNLDTNILSRNSVTPNTTVPLAANLAATLANQTTIKDRIGAFTGTGINNILGFFRSQLRSDIATDPTDIGGTFDSTQHSSQSIITRGDAAWITGGGGGITDSLNVKELIPMSVDLADTAKVRLGLMLTNALDDLPSVAEITPGTISIDHKAIGGVAWLNVVLDVACSEINGLIYFDEIFDSASGYAEGDSLRITFKGQKITVSANDYEIIGTTGRFFYTEVRQTQRGTNNANTIQPIPAASASTLANQNAIISTIGTPAGASVSADIAELKTFLDTEIADILLDTSTTLDGKLNAIKAITDQFVFTVANEVDSNMKAVNDSTEAADDMKTAAETMVKGSAATGTLSLIEMTTNLVISVAGQYNGAVLIFANNTTTAALRGQRTGITATTVLNGKLGFAALTTPPVNGDTFVIV